MYMQTEGKHARKERGGEGRGGGEGPTIISHWSVLSVLNDELLSRCRAKIPITSYYKEDLPHISTFCLHDMSRSPRLTPSIFGNWITVEGGKGLGMKLTTCIISPSLFAFWNRVLEVGMRLGYLAYSGKLLREKTFANFGVLLFAIDFSIKFGGVASFGGTSNQSTKVFSGKIFHQFTKGFSRKNFPLYGTNCYRAYRLG